jgi:hypothetical protein
MRSVYKYLVLAVIITSGYAATKNTKMTDESIIVNWIDAIGKIPAGHFVGVADSSALPNPAKAESPRWAGQVFLPGMGPYDLIRKPKHSYVCNETDLDLLRHEIQSTGLETVVIYEGRNFFAIRFSLSQHPAGNELALAQKKAEQLLQMKGQGYKWKFNSRQVINGDVLLSTNTEQSIVFLPDWMHRADALIRGNDLYIITYKKLPSVTGLLNDYEWFPNELRH